MSAPEIPVYVTLTRTGSSRGCWWSEGDPIAPAPNMEVYHALPAASYAALVAERDTLKAARDKAWAALDRAWWNIQNSDTEGVCLSSRDDALIRAVLSEAYETNRRSPTATPPVSP